MTIKQQLLVLTHAVVTGVVVSLLFIFYTDFTDSKAIWINVAIASFFFIFDILPSIILHIQYWLVNRKAVLIINKEDRSICYKKNVTNINFSIDDISQFQCFVSYGRKTGVYAFALYRYYKIILKDKSEIIITCLMINDIENVLENKLNLKAEEKPKFFCFLSNSSWISPLQLQRQS